MGESGITPGEAGTPGNGPPDTGSPEAGPPEAAPADGASPATQPAEAGPPTASIGAEPTPPAQAAPRDARPDGLSPGPAPASAPPEEKPRAAPEILQFDVPADHADRLAALGIKGLRLPGRLRMVAGLRIEPPGFIGGSYNLMTRIEIGAFTLINGGRIAATRIGRYCSLAAEVTLGSGEHPLDRVTTSTLGFDGDFHGWTSFYAPERAEELKARALPFPGARRFTTLGHDVWLGHGVFVRAGVTIGTGAVIGAGAVVVNDIPPYAIALGVPAKVKRFRYDEATIARLLASRWWEYPLPELLGEEMRDPHRFCDLIEARVAAGTLQPYAPEPVTGEALARAFAAPR